MAKMRRFFEVWDRLFLIANCPADITIGASTEKGNAE